MFKKAWAASWNGVDHQPIHPVVAAGMPLVAMFANVVAVFALVASRSDYRWLFVFAAVWIVIAPLWLWLTTKQKLPFWSGFLCWLFTLICMVAGVAGNISVFYSIMNAV